MNAGRMPENWLESTRNVVSSDIEPIVDGSVPDRWLEDKALQAE